MGNYDCPSHVRFIGTYNREYVESGKTTHVAQPLESLITLRLIPLNENRLKIVPEYVDSCGPIQEYFTQLMDEIGQEWGIETPSKVLKEEPERKERTDAKDRAALAFYYLETGQATTRTAAARRCKTSTETMKSYQLDSRVLEKIDYYKKNRDQAQRDLSKLNKRGKSS